MRTCQVHGCKEPLSKPDHDLCLRHWKASRDGKLDECSECGGLFEPGLPHCPKCGPAKAAVRGGEQLSSTKIGKHFGRSAQQVNLVLAELGWIEKGPSNKGWVPSAQGTRREAVLRHARETGIPYVVWPPGIVSDKVFLAAFEELRAPAPAAVAETAAEERSFGDRRPAQPGTLRATDGHLVRSRGELLIDNWLYMGGIVHAYERRLPIEDEAYCDFWIPNGKVYIEYWGIDGDASYEARRQKKLALYRQHGLDLIEVTNDDIDRLDDVLPPKLLRFGVSSK